MPRRSPCHGRDRCSGQATLDYLAVVAVAAAVLVAGSGVAMAKGGAIAASVRSQVVRALCVVTGGDCDRDLAPCTVSARADGLSGHVNLLFARIGKDRLAVIDERSDGTFAVTLMSDWDLGAEGGLGLKGELATGRRSYAVGAEFQAALLAHEGRGSTWTVGSREEAQALVDAVRGIKAALLPQKIGGTVLPEPDQTYYEHGWSVTLGAKAGGGSATGALTLSAKDLDGARSDRRTGHYVVYLRRSNGLDVLLDGTAGGDRRVKGVGAAGGDHQWAIELDADGVPVDLMILSAGEYAGSFSLPPMLREAAGHLGIPAKGARRYELETHLDLGDPENLAAASAFIAAVREGGPRPGQDRAPVSAALAARLRDHGVAHGRTYDVDSEVKGGSAHGGIGGKFGGGAQLARRTTRLIAAVTRGPDGTWRPREDCVA